MKNHDVLRHILKHCNKIQNVVSFFGNEYDSFCSNEIYQDAVSFSLAQIGELTTHLSADFKAETSDKIDWRSVKALRNIVVHNYDSVNFSVLWNIMKNDIPEMMAFCSDYVQDHEFLGQCAVEPEIDDDEEWEP